MTHIDTGQLLPNFNFTVTTQGSCQLSDFKGNPLILYFYPRDATPGCTDEAKDFREHYEAFKAFNATILGISRDTLSSHERFKNKLALPFELISDPHEDLCQLFNVMRQKSMFGKQVRGIERSTFLVDSDTKIYKVWRKVKVPGHVVEVLGALKQMIEASG